MNTYLHDVLNTYKLKIKWLNKTTLGLIDFDKRTIYINLELFIVDTFLHESLHHVYYNDSESKIIKKTNDKISRMSIRDIHLLSNTVLKKSKKKLLTSHKK